MATYKAKTTTEVKRSPRKKLVADDDIVCLVSDEELEREKLPNASKEFIAWYETFMAKLERQYPVPFEAVIKESITNYKRYTSNYMEAVRMAIGKKIFYLIMLVVAWIRMMDRIKKKVLFLIVLQVIV